MWAAQGGSEGGLWSPWQGLAINKMRDWALDECGLKETFVPGRGPRVSKDVGTGLGWQRRGLWKARASPSGTARELVEGRFFMGSAWAMKSPESLAWPQPGRGTDMKL